LLVVTKQPPAKLKKKKASQVLGSVLTKAEETKQNLAID
jgi:hypothetical protein